MVDVRTDLAAASQHLWIAIDGWEDGEVGEDHVLHYLQAVIDELEAAVAADLPQEVIESVFDWVSPAQLLMVVAAFGADIDWPGVSWRPV